ncbi:MAG: hypothetical protein PCFJNLEI_02978 [Verrucomicrobiae bacterium]|nr:hypothetical protein [Verrucomicrobiae bacterium]
MYVRVGRSARDPLTATAWAIEDVVFVSCDVAMVNDKLRQAILDRLPAEVPKHNVILSATHTHDSLVFFDNVYAHPDGDVMTASECLAWAGERIAGAIATAWRDRQPRQIGRAFGHAVVGHNRYAIYSDETGAMYGKTNRPDFHHIGGYEDHSVDMLFTWEPDGRLAGVTLAIPCPSQVEEHLLEFSADYWHEVRAELQRRFGKDLFVVGWCAPAGDQSPHFLLYGREEEEMRQRRGVTERQEIALRIADAVERALACTKPTGETPVFRHVGRELQLPRFSISQKDVSWSQAQYDKWIAEGGDPTSWWPIRLREVIDTANGLVKPAPVTARIHVLRIGTVGIATNPFELFLDYSLCIKARSPAAQTVLTQLTDGSCLYLPSERAVAAGSYGAAAVVCPVGPAGGRQLVEETLKTLNELFEEK